MASRVHSRMVTLALAVRERLASAGRRRAPENPKRILIAHNLLLGDTLMLTPLLAKLRERNPGSEIIMAAPKAIVPLYEKHPYGVRAVAFSPREDQNLSALRAHGGFDLAIVPGDNRYGWLALALRSRWIIAFAGDRPGYKNWPVDELVPYPAIPGAWGDMVASLIPGPAPAPFRPDSWPEPECAAFELPQTPFCVLHAGASTPLKLWEVEKWRGLAEFLRARGLTIVWSAGEGEEHIIRAVDPEGKFPSYAGRLDLAQMWRLVRRARLLVCPDTGIAHLGRIVNTPTVTLFGPGSALICGAGDFWRTSPYRAVTVENFHCRDQKILFRREIDWVRRCGRSTRECASPACMQALGTEPVLAAVESLLQLSRETLRQEPML